MINELKTFAFFGCSLTSRFRQGLCKCFNEKAQKLNVNMIYFNSLGKIGEKNTENGEREADIFDFIDLDMFDGIIFDGEGYNAETTAEKVTAKLKTAKCPVVSISSHVDGFYNINFEDASGMCRLVEHFTDHHKHTKIGFMSGPLNHPDAQLRLAEFKSVMKERGLPEEGIGVFEGDFWFHKGEEAADFFLSRSEYPESIVCANDYMAIAIISAFKQRGIRVPQDIAVSGFDGTTEGKQYVPHLTTATREREDIADKAMEILMKLSENRSDTAGGEYTVSPRTIFNQSCGCRSYDHKAELQNIDDIYKDVRLFGYCLNDAEAAMLKLNKVDKLDHLEAAFRECATNFGDYSAFFLFMQTDSAGNLSCSNEYDTPADNFKPVIWIDTKNKYRRDTDAHPMAFPESDSDAPHFFYVMTTHCSDRMFGYALIEMKDDDIFNDFYNIFLLELSVTIERLWKNDRINKLYEEQKALYEKQRVLSISDELTGMLNRRGFDHFSRKALRSIKGRSTVCTMVIDMDGLKFINDVYGHNEGDTAIKAAANIIMDCCTSDEISGRTGGDEFYIFAVDYSQDMIDRFTSDLMSQCEKYNAESNKPYKVELSFGTYLTETDEKGNIENFLKISDSRMYEQKMAKPNRRKRE